MPLAAANLEGEYTFLLCLGEATIKPFPVIETHFINVTAINLFNLSPFNLDYASIVGIEG